MSVAPPRVPDAADVPDVGGEKPVPRRAGRNLPAAIAVGLSLGAVILVTLFAARPVFAYGVLTVAIGIAIWELSRAISLTGAKPAQTPLVLGGVMMLVAAYLRGPEALVFGLAATSLACLVWRLPEGSPGVLRDVSASIFVATYVPLLAGFCALMVAEPDGAARVVSFIATTVCSDVGGYVAGVLKGKHAMAPTVSPRKTWEGFAGSVAACCICGVALVSTVMEIAWWEGAIFGLVVVVVATLGDLGESMIKRDIGIKDMGHLLPGHGGIMDRLDSLLPCAPVTWLLLAAFT